MDEEIKEVKYYLIPGDWRLVFKIIAMIVSWYFNKSLFWLVIHYLFGWIYLVYILLTGEFSNGGFTDIVNHYIS